MTDPRDTLARIRERGDNATPALLDSLDAVLKLHPRVVVMAADPEFGQMEDDAICGACIVDHEAADWPCPNVRAITTALEAIR